MFDENMPPRIAKALNAFFENEHDIVHMRDKFRAGIKDIEWINELSADGDWVIISQDRAITRSKVEYAAFKRSKLIGFFLSRSLEKEKLIKKLERILVLWPTIEKQVTMVKPGAVFELPMKTTKLKQLK